MTKKERYQFIDNPDQNPSESEDRALAALLREVSDLETHEPGQDYWNQFNYRLQKKLATVRPARRRFSLKIPLWLGAAASLIILFALLNTRDVQPRPGLEELDHEALALISQTLDPFVDDDPYADLADTELTLLLDVFDTPLSDEDLIYFDAEAFKALWRTEG